MNDRLKSSVAKFLSLLLMAVVLHLFFPAPAMAVCTISSTSINFGSYDVFNSAPLDTTGSVVYQCGNLDRNITISLDRGGAPSFNPRRMTQGTWTLNYNLYLNASRTVIWGDGSGGTQAFFENNPQNNQNITIPIYGRVPAGQGVRAGPYTNTITVIVNF